MFLRRTVSLPMPTAPGFQHEDSHPDEILAHYFRIRDKKVTVVENGTALSLKLELNADTQGAMPAKDNAYEDCEFESR